MIRQIQKTTIINIRETSLINLVLMQDLADYLGKRDELKIGEKGIRCIYKTPKRRWTWTHYIILCTVKEAWL